MHTVNVRSVQPKSFEYGFRPIYYFSRVAGLWPFQIVRNSNGSIEKARVRLIDMLWFFTSIFVYLTALFYVYKNMEQLQVSNASYISLSILFMFQTMCLLFGACGIVLDMYNRKKLINILDKFNAFDCKVECVFLLFFLECFN